MNQKTRKKNIIFHLICLHNIGIDDAELQRQNRITAQIVANYLERRLFPFKRPTHRLPTVDEILPSTSPQQATRQQRLLPTTQTSELKTKITRHLQHGNNNDDAANNDFDDADYSDEDFDNTTNYPNEQDIDPENLQSVESNHVDSYYSESNDDNEGRSILFFVFIVFRFSCHTKNTHTYTRCARPRTPKIT